ncbi:MFS transporter [Cohnella suwonensis]|uniref:MFS transporter n=1 Tax=Cohnella suwonensis TaxID=696072 RepID=A0ABW0LX05_9BACL
MIGPSTDSAIESPYAGTAAARAPALWRNRPFLFVFASFCLSLLGNTFHGMALNLWVIQTTGSAKHMSALLVTHLAVGTLLGSFAGTVADRMNRRQLMIAADIVRVLLVAGVVVSISVPGTPFIVLIVLTALIAFASLFHSPSLQASLGGIVGQGRIHQAVGAMNIADNLVRISGFALGGVFVAAFGGAMAIAVDGLTFLLSACFVFAAGKFPASVMPATATANDSVAPPRMPTFTEDFAGGFKYLWRDPFALPVLALLPVVTLFFLSMLMLVQVSAVGDWHASPFHFGLIEACIPLGYVAGSSLILFLGGRLRGRGKWILGSVSAMGPAYWLISRSDSALGAIPYILLSGCLLSFVTLILNVGLRARIEPSMQGRAFGTLASLTSVAPPIGLAAASFLSDAYGPSPVIAAGGIAIAVLSVAGWTLLKEIRSYD